MISVLLSVVIAKITRFASTVLEDMNCLLIILVKVPVITGMFQLIQFVRHVMKIAQNAFISLVTAHNAFLRFTLMNQVANAIKVALIRWLLMFQNVWVHVLLQHTKIVKFAITVLPSVLLAFQVQLVLHVCQEHLCITVYAMRTVLQKHLILLMMCAKHVIL